MSQIQSETKEIDGHKYEMYMLMPMVSHDLLMDVAKMIGPSLGPLFDVFFSSAIKKDESVLDQQVDSAFFTKAAAALFSGINKNVLKTIIKTFEENTLVDGQKLDSISAAHFLGRLHVMYQWLAWGMQVQWGKSLSVLVSALPVQNTLSKAEALQSQST